jgi:flagellar hook assembly protein FlgD
VRIYDVMGRLVRELDLGEKETGYYLDRSRAVYWDGRNDLGEKVSSGVYFYQVEAGRYSKVRRMVILR